MDTAGLAIIPSCYSIHATPHPSAKLQTVVEETLFYIFYSTPSHELQILAAKEL